MLRATGVRKGRIVAVFIYEALVLVLSSSILGIVVGSVIGFSFSA